MTHDEFCSQVDAALERISDRLHTTGALLTIVRGEVPKDAALAWLLAHMPGTRDEILDGCGRMLKLKNRAYGNSALDPVHIFSRADRREGLLVRIDDKLSRLARGSDAGEDTKADLLGYLVMLEIAEQRNLGDVVVTVTLGLSPDGEAHEPVTPGDFSDAADLGGPWIVAKLRCEREDCVAYGGCAGVCREPPAWVVPFLSRPGHYAHANGQTVGPSKDPEHAAQLLASALGWGGGERHAYQAYEVPSA